MKSEKQQMTEEIELLYQEKSQNALRKETYKYFRILEPKNIKQAEMKERIKRRMRKLLESKLNSRNLVKRINNS